VCAAEFEIGSRRHFHSAARCNVIEVPAVRGDEQLRSEKSCPLVAKTPGNVGLFRFDLLQVNSVRQKNCEPRLARHCFRIRFVDLNLDVARLHTHIGEAPLSQKHAPRIEFCGDPVSIECLHRLLPMVRFEVVALRRERTDASNRCVTRLREMQSLRRFLLHRDTEGVTFQITREQRT